MALVMLVISVSPCLERRLRARGLMGAGAWSIMFLALAGERWR